MTNYVLQIMDIYNITQQKRSKPWDKHILLQMQGYESPTVWNHKLMGL